MSRGNGVKGHTRSGAEDESRTRGPITHDTWCGRALPAELHPQICEAKLRPVPKLVSRQVVKERPPSRIGFGSAIHRSRVCANAQAGSSQKTKRPGSFRNPGPCEQSLEGARDFMCRRSPLPDATGPRPDQAGSPSAKSGAVHSRNRRTTSSPQWHAPTRPTPSWVGWL
jgi:hypothetical protein